MKWYKFLLAGHLCLFALSNNSRCQGFMLLDTLDKGRGEYVNLQTINDTIFTVGFGYINSELSQGMFISVYDTTGIKIDSFTHTDPNHAFSTKDVTDFHFFQERFLITAGSAFNFNLSRFEHFLLIFDLLDYNLNCVFFEQDTNLRSEIIYDLNSDSENIYLYGLAQTSNFKVNIFRMTIDISGKRFDTKYYGDPNKSNVYGNLLTASPNSTFIGSHEDDRTWIFEINSLGEIVWEWHDTGEEKTSIADAMYVQGDSLYFTGRRLEDDQGGFYTPFIACLSLSTKELVFRNYLSELSGTITFIRSIIKLNEQDDFFILSGSKSIFAWVDNKFKGFVGAWHYAVQLDGDSLWSRIDTLQYLPEPYSSRTIIYGSSLLSSGSIISVGEVKVDINERSGALIMKLDKNGCMMSPCDLTTSITENRQDIAQIELFPNPNDGRFSLSIPDNLNVREMTVFNSLGQKVSTIIEGFDGIYQIKLLSSKPGIFHLSIPGVLAKSFIVNDR